MHLEHCNTDNLFFVLIEAEGVGFVFFGGLFGGLRPVLSVSLLLAWLFLIYSLTFMKFTIKALKGKQQQYVKYYR